MLLKVEGIDVNRADKNRETPLFIAAEKGQQEIVSMLLKLEGINVNQANKDGRTPLYEELSVMNGKGDSGK